MSRKSFSLSHATGVLEGIYQKYRQMGASSTIPIMQDIQESFGYLPEDAVNWIADRMDLPRSSFFGVATFYSQFHMKPRGKNVITVCSGTACHVKGSEKIINSTRRHFNFYDDQDTTADMEFTLEKVNCVGACSIAPVVIINKKVHGKASSAAILKAVKALSKKL